VYIYIVLYYTGYSLQLVPVGISNHTISYDGDWISEVMPVTSDHLCISLNVSALPQLQLSFELLTDSVAGYVNFTNLLQLTETSTSDILLIFEMPITASIVQAIAHISTNTVIRKVDIQNGSCIQNCEFK
jgi:hypothetical protein